MRILIRTSRTAIWARRIAGLSLPLVIIPVFLHRKLIIDPDRFLLVELVACGVAALALLLSVLALIRLWRSGDRGWDKAILAFLISLVCLAPFAYGAYALYRNPSVTDVSTNVADPVPLAVLSGTAPPVDPARLAEIDTKFPNLRTRNYQADVSDLYAMALRQVNDRGWDIRDQRAPLSAADTGEIDAVVTTWLGWRDEVGIRIIGTADGATVDMRSASLGGGYSDLGANGGRIEEYLVALDAAVSDQLRNGDDGDEASPAPPKPVAPSDPNFVFPADRPDDLY
ncbi:MAG TPA: DUF1499 domain-containing protein [Devosiaceae bacterium]